MKTQTSPCLVCNPWNSKWHSDREKKNTIYRIFTVHMFVIETIFSSIFWWCIHGNVIVSHEKETESFTYLLSDGMAKQAELMNPKMETTF